MARGAGGGGTIGRSGPRVHARSKVGVEDEAASMDGQQTRSTRQSGARSCIHWWAAGVEHKAASMGALRLSFIENGQAAAAGVRTDVASRRLGGNHELSQHFSLVN